MWPTLKQSLGLASIALVLSPLSICVSGHVIDVVPGSEDCQAGCRAAAAGWPVAFIVDGHGLSPHGSADFLGFVLGLDRLDGMRAMLNWLVWLCIIGVAWTGWSRWRRRSS